MNPARDHLTVREYVDEARWLWSCARVTRRKGAKHAAADLERRAKEYLSHARNVKQLASGRCFVIKSSDIGRCRFTIMVPEHYREDGSCRCNDAEHRAKMIAEWGYSTDDFKGIPLREVARG